MEQLRDAIPSIILSIVMGICVYPIIFIGLNDLSTLALQVVVDVIAYLIGSIMFKLEPFLYLKNMLLSKKG